jgi:hypothetical protein
MEDLNQSWLQVLTTSAAIDFGQRTWPPLGLVNASSREHGTKLPATTGMDHGVVHDAGAVIIAPRFV